MLPFRDTVLRLRQRLAEAYEAELIAMLPKKVDGRPRYLPVAPPLRNALVGRLLRPYVWQVGIPLLVLTVLGRSARRGHLPVVHDVGSALVMLLAACGFVALWSWLAKSTFESHWNRLASEAYHAFCWRALRDGEEVTPLPPPGASPYDPQFQPRARQRTPRRR